MAGVGRKGKLAAGNEIGWKRSRSGTTGVEGGRSLQRVE